jgi:hypothetical protein
MLDFLNCLAGFFSSLILFDLSLLLGSHFFGPLFGFFLFLLEFKGLLLLLLFVVDQFAEALFFELVKSIIS